MISLSQVSPGNANICMKQTNAPRRGTNGTQGVLNGRGASGSVFRIIKMPIQTIIKASNVPMDTSSPKSPMGNMPAINAVKKTVISVE